MLHIIQSWNPWKLKIYFDLLGRANYKDRDWEGIEIKRGQTLTSLRRIADDISYVIQYTDEHNRIKKPSTSTVKRIIEDLKMKHYIDTKMVHRGMIITVNHYEYFATTSILKMLHSFNVKMTQRKLPQNEGPQWMKDAGLI